jgi:hypothetical protein
VRKLLIGTFCVLAVLLGGYWLFVDTIVGAAIERATAGALGVQARVGFARLSLLDGDLHLRRLRVANPPGFEEPHFITVREIEVEADPRRLRDPVVEIPLISFDGVDVALERADRRSNYETILENMGSFEKDETPATPTDTGRRYVVRLLRIRDVTARVEWNDMAAKQTKLDLEIPQIDVRNLGEEGGGLTGSELSNLITKAILGSIARQGGNLPRGMLSGLESGLRDLGRLPGVAVRGGKALADSTGAVGGGVLDSVGAAGRAIGGLFKKDAEGHEDEEKK